VLALFYFHVVSIHVVMLCVSGAQIFLYVYKSQLVLSPSSGSFPMWQDLPAPLIARVFLFNVTNPSQVSSPTAEW
jgi:hypothetical protein